jgi:pentatricopeptide repeat protein
MHRLISRHVVNYTSRFYTTTTAAAAVAIAATTNPLISKYKQQLTQKEPAVWETYQSLRSPNLIKELKREDFLKLRANLWKLKEKWGTEGRILQVLEDMKQQGHAWTISEYNEYFIAKLFQAQHQDILTLYQQDFVNSSTPNLKLSIGSFNVILATLLQCGEMDQAIRLIKEANSKWDVLPDLRDFDRTMNRCMPKNSKVVKQAKELIVEYGLDRIKVLNANLLHLFKEKRINDIKWIMETKKNKQHDITTYNILIKGYSDIRMTRDALSVYNQMTTFGIKPNGYICSTLLNIFGHNRDLESAENLVRETILNGFKPDESIYNQLIKVYFKCRKTEKAFQAFDEIQKDPTLKLNDIILNTMINGLVENKEMKLAGLLYDKIIESGQFKPDMITFNTMLKGYTKSNEMESASKIVKDMFRYNMEPDTVTYTTLIDSIFTTRQPTKSIELINYINNLNIKPNIYTFNAIINNWIKQGNIEEAEATVSLMKQSHIKPTIHTYTNLIQGYIEKMDLNKAITIFQGLLKHDNTTKPDRATFNFMIMGFLNHNRLNDAYNCLEYMKLMKISPTKDTWKLILDECVAQKDWTIGKKVVIQLDASGFVITMDSLKRPYSIVKANC